MIVKIVKNNKIIKQINVNFAGIELLAYVGDLCDEFFGDFMYKKEIKDNSGTWFVMDEKNKIHVSNY